MSDIIFHHYLSSPVSEKVRIAFGIKKLAWHSVEQNRLPDRPELFAMTGGYRRIPVMQIGADMYCDTQCILDELETRFPAPSLFPQQPDGLPFGVARWTDNELFTLAFRIVFAPAYSELPPALVKDRTRLYLGPNADIEKEAADLPHTLAQFRAHMGWLNDRLKGGNAYLLGNEPGMADILCWAIVWLVKDRYAGFDALFAGFDALLLWVEAMEAIGHGSPTDMTVADALEIAREAESQTTQIKDPHDPQQLEPGTKALVSPLTESGEQAISGTIHAVTRNRVSLMSHHKRCGTTCLHFPRIGYRVTPMP